MSKDIDARETQLHAKKIPINQLMYMHNNVTLGIAEKYVLVRSIKLKLMHVDA